MRGASGIQIEVQRETETILSLWIQFIRTSTVWWRHDFWRFTTTKATLSAVHHIVCVLKNGCDIWLLITSKAQSRPWGSTFLIICQTALSGYIVWQKALTVWPKNPMDFPTDVITGRNIWKPHVTIIQLIIQNSGHHFTYPEMFNYTTELLPWGNWTLG